MLQGSGEGEPERLKEVVSLKFKYLFAHKYNPQKRITRKEWTENLNSPNSKYPQPQRDQVRHIIW